MKFTYTKKILALVLFAATAFAGCNYDEETATGNSTELNASVTAASTSAPEVSLIYANAYLISAYGIPSGSRSFSVKVKNIAYDKSVVIYGIDGNGAWVDLCSLTYKEAAEEGYEIWTGGFNQYTTSDYGDQFIVRYEVAGQTYYDNNNGNNYHLAALDGPLLGKDINVRLSGASFYQNNSGSYFGGSVDVRNIDYTKAVSIVYTTDDWATTKTVEASFRNYYLYFKTYISAPTVNGTEPWSFYVTVNGATEIKYAVKYDVAGQTYWDNNNGKNYTITLQ